MFHRASFADQVNLKSTYARSFLVAALLCAVALLSAAEQPTPAPDSTAGPAEALYLKLRSVGLDKAQVYKIREASLDRAKLHLSLDDGTIAFTQAIDGHITGAFFEGYGEVLIMPPTQAEQASLSLFTGAAILEETFSTAYLRFNDDAYSELQPFLRPADNPDAFISQFDLTAKNLATEDALRLLLSFSDSLPALGSDQSSAQSSDQRPAQGSANHAISPADHMLHAYLQGNKVGAFDVRYDSLFHEQIEAGQHKRVSTDDYYDVWTSFAVPALGARGEGTDEGEPLIADFDVTSFKIQAHIKPVKELAAKAILNITPRKKTRRMLVFELSRMLQVSDVSADGRPVEFIHNQAIEGSHLAKQGNDVIAVLLPSPLNPGQKIELSFDYSGAVLSEAADGLLYVGDHGTWYPNLGFAMASFDLEFHYPAGWMLVATGHRTEAKVAGTEQISNWVTQRPVPVAGFNLGKYSQAVSHAGKIAVTTYATSNLERGFPGSTVVADSEPPVLPIIPRSLGPAHVRSMPVMPPKPSPASNAQMVADISARAIESYSHYFGPYPYGELAITQLPGTVSQGWPGLIFLSSYSFLTPDEKSRVESNPMRRLMSDQVIAHETAHQWWGDLVNWQTYHDQWMMEALANYSALLLLESRDPAKFQSIMRSYRDDLLAKNPNGVPLMNAGAVTLGFRLASSQFPGAYDAVCYERGTWLMHMLRTMLRESPTKAAGSVHTHVEIENEPFTRALRKLRKDYEDKAVNTAELMHVFESELPPTLWYEGRKSLDWFYEGWVNGSAVPGFALHDLKFTEKGKSTEVTGTLVQEHAPDTLVTAVPVYASIRGKNIFLKRIFAEGQETQFHVAAPPGTRRLVIDPEQTILSLAK